MLEIRKDLVFAVGDGPENFVGRWTRSVHPADAARPFFVTMNGSVGLTKDIL
jgi:hypothetical protein